MQEAEGGRVIKQTSKQKREGPPLDGPLFVLIAQVSGLAALASLEQVDQAAGERHAYKASSHLWAICPRHDYPCRCRPYQANQENEASEYFH
jgi:hypothetical protein